MSLAKLYIILITIIIVQVQLHVRIILVESFTLSRKQQNILPRTPGFYVDQTVPTQIMVSNKMTSNHDNNNNNINNEFTPSWEPEMAQTIYTQMMKKQKEQRQRNESNSARASSQQQQQNTPHTFIVAIVGCPGSGKSSSSQILSKLLHDKLQSSLQSKVLVMPMDGYHLSLAQLKSQPNSTDLIYRRGAPDTFDPQLLLQDLKSIKNNNSVQKIPGFDHAIGDPQPNAYTFDKNQHSIVICEGLYLLHVDENIGWSTEIAKQFDMTIFMNANVDTCIERLKVRNKCIPGYTPEEIDLRCDVVDRANAMLVLRSKDRAMYVVDSIVAS
jgi:pantothenate kinase